LGSGMAVRPLRSKAYFIRLGPFTVPGLFDYGGRHGKEAIDYHNRIYPGTFYYPGELPIPPVEAVIALSVVFLAAEIAVQNKNSLTYKYPILVSSSFGLLHGFGFAAVLGEIGLPQQEVITSLLFFNIGVEIGQVLFIVGVLVALWIGRWIMSVFWIDNGFNLSTRTMEKVTVYAVGCVASYWVVERVAGFF